MQMQVLMGRMSLGSAGLDARPRRTNGITWQPASFPTNPLPAKTRLANDDDSHRQTHRSKHQDCNLPATIAAKRPVACITIKHRVVCRTSGGYGVSLFTLDIVQVFRILFPKIREG